MFNSYVELPEAAVFERYADNEILMDTAVDLCRQGHLAGFLFWRCVSCFFPTQDQNTDIFCPMYPSHEKLVKYGQLHESDVAALPLIMVEYAHAMGNTLGAFKEYWDVIYQYGVPWLRCWDHPQAQLRLGRNAKSQNPVVRRELRSWGTPNSLWIPQ